MEEEDDDFYAPNGAGADSTSAEKNSGQARNARNAHSESSAKTKQEQNAEELEEGEEEEEDEEDEDDSDSDIDIITERKDGSVPEPPQAANKLNGSRSIPVKKPSTEPTSSLSSRGIKSEAHKEIPLKPGSEYPAIATSTIKLDEKPVYEPVGKPITQVDLDEDFKDDDKPWRRPGSDITDFFNYGFDEFTWASYCLREDKMRSDITDEKKKMQDFGMMMDMGGMPQMPVMPGIQPPTGPGQMPQMPGMGDIPPEMQAMMAQMMAQGADPSQMDPAAMFAAMQQSGGQAGGPGGNQGQSFGAGQGFGAQNQQPQQMGFGFDQNMMGGNDGGAAASVGAGGAGRNRQGNFNNRGRGGNRRNW